MIGEKQVNACDPCHSKMLSVAGYLTIGLIFVVAFGILIGLFFIRRTELRNLNNRGKRVKVMSPLPTHQTKKPKIVKKYNEAQSQVKKVKPLKDDKASKKKVEKTIAIPEIILTPSRSFDSEKEKTINESEKEVAPAYAEAESKYPNLYGEEKKNQDLYGENDSEKNAADSVVIQIESTEKAEVDVERDPSHENPETSLNDDSVAIQINETLDDSRHLLEEAEAVTHEINDSLIQEEKIDAEENKKNNSEPEKQFGKKKNRKRH